MLQFSRWASLTPRARLDRYAAAFGPGVQMRTPVKAPSSPSTAMHSATNLPPRSRIPNSQSNSDVKNFDGQQVGQTSSKLPRSSSMIISPSQAHGASYWNEGIPPPPRIFPGVVHERTRRGSVRHGSSSEKDFNALERPKLSAWERNDKSLYDAVPEESGEQEQREGSS